MIYNLCVCEATSSTLNRSFMGTIRHFGFGVFPAPLARSLPLRIAWRLSDVELIDIPN